RAIEIHLGRDARAHARADDLLDLLIALHRLRFGLAQELRAPHAPVGVGDVERDGARRRLALRIGRAREPARPRHVGLDLETAPDRYRQIGGAAIAVPAVVARGAEKPRLADAGRRRAGELHV